MSAAAAAAPAAPTDAAAAAADAFAENINSIFDSCAPAPRLVVVPHGKRVEERLEAIAQAAAEDAARVAETVEKIKAYAAAHPNALAPSADDAKALTALIGRIGTRVPYTAFVPSDAFQLRWVGFLSEHYDSCIGVTARCHADGPTAFTRETLLHFGNRVDAPFNERVDVITDPFEVDRLPPPALYADVQRVMVEYTERMRERCFRCRLRGVAAVALKPVEDLSIASIIDRLGAGARGQRHVLQGFQFDLTWVDFLAYWFDASVGVRIQRAYGPVAEHVITIQIDGLPAQSPAEEAEAAARAAERKHARDVCATEASAEASAAKRTKPDTAAAPAAAAAPEDNGIVVFLRRNPESSDDNDYLIVPVAPLTAEDLDVLRKYTDLCAHEIPVRGTASAQNGESAEVVAAMYEAHLLYTTLDLIMSGAAADRIATKSVWERISQFMTPGTVPDDDDDDADKYETDESDSIDDPDEKAEYLAAKARYDAERTRRVAQFERRTAAFRDHVGRMERSLAKVRNAFVAYTIELHDDD